MSELQRVEELRLMEAIRDDYRDLASDEEIPLFIETKRTVTEGR
jgi:hypothetical protein